MDDTGRERRVALLAHPSADLYGSDRVLLETVTGLDRAGWDVVVTVPAPGPLVPQVERRGGRVALAPTGVLRKSALTPVGAVRMLVTMLRGVAAGVALVRRIRPQVMLVNTQTVPGWLLVARLTRVPVVCHVHEAEGSASPLLRRLLAAPLLLADRLVVNSRFSLGVLTGAIPRLEGRSEVVPNAVPGPPGEVGVPDRPRDPLRLVYVGRLSPRKGVDVAVDAALALRARGTAVRLDLVGAVFAGYEWYEDELRTTVRRAGAEDDIRFAGFCDDVWPHLADADVALVPSRGDEPFGNTAVEALLAARPVVASATTGLLEATAGYASCRTVPPDDPTAVADAVAELVAVWDGLPLAADRDAAAARHSPSTYQEHVGSLLAAVAAER